MDPQVALETKRQEVSEEILAIKELIPSARIFNVLSGLFPKGTSGYWLSNLVILNLILFGPWIILGSLLKETGKNPLIVAPSIIAIEFAICGCALGHVIVQAILSDTANKIIDKINHVDDFSKLLRWLKSSWSYHEVFTFIVPFSIAWTCLGIAGMSLPFHEYVGFGLSLTVLLVGLVAAMAFYFPFWVSLLAFHLKDYQYEMNAVSPANSEIINSISEVLTKRIYIFAAFFASLTFVSSSNLVYEQLRITFAVPFLLLAWIGTTAQFILTRLTLRTIVDKAKWKTLNKLQIKINSLATSGDLSDEEIAEKLLRLADIYARVVVSETNVFDLKTISTFGSQLMLPLLGLLLANFDKILRLFR